MFGSKDGRVCTCSCARRHCARGGEGWAYVSGKFSTGAAGLADTCRLPLLNVNHSTEMSTLSSACFGKTGLQGRGRVEWGIQEKPLSRLKWGQPHTDRALKAKE